MELVNMVVKSWPIFIASWLYSIYKLDRLVYFIYIICAHFTFIVFGIFLKKNYVGPFLAQKK